MKIVSVSKVSESSIYQGINGRKCKEQPRGFPLIPSDGNSKIDDHQRKELREKFGECQRTNSTVTKQERIIGTVEKANQDSKKDSDKGIVSKASIFYVCELPITEEQKHQIKQNTCDQKVA